MENNDFKNEDMLQEYEKLFLDQTLSIEEIEAIMIEKYGSRYEPYRERELNNETKSNDTEHCV